MARRPPVIAFKVYRKGHIMEVKVYKVPASKQNPLGYRFGCFMVDATSGEEIVGYDNHWPKGSHRHFGKKEEPYLFKDIQTLLDDFNTS
jgi:hypothetical protein